MARKRKRREAFAAKSDHTPQCVKVRGPDGKIVYKYEGMWGPQVRYKRALPKNGNTGVWRVA